MAEKKIKGRVRDADRTVAALKKATIDQLISCGFAGLSIIPITEKAGVSRGALFHHFPTKDLLVAAAFEDLLVEFAERLHTTGAELRAGKIAIDEFIVRVSDTVASDMFIGSMEIALGIRSDPQLYDLVGGAVERWRKSLFEFWDSTFELPGMSREEVVTHWAMASNLLRGHAFTSNFGVEPDTKKRLYRGFARMVLQNAVIRRDDPKVVKIKKAKNPKGEKK